MLTGCFTIYSSKRLLNPSLAHFPLEAVFISGALIQRRVLRD